MRARKTANTINRTTVEAAAKIRFSANIQGANRERAEAEAEMKEKAEKTREAREARAKAEAETEDKAMMRDKSKVI